MPHPKKYVNQLARRAAGKSLRGRRARLKPLATDANPIIQAVKRLSFETPPRLTYTRITSELLQQKEYRGKDHRWMYEKVTSAFHDLADYIRRALPDDPRSDLELVLDLLCTNHPR